VLLVLNSRDGPVLEFVMFGEDTYILPLGGSAVVKQTAWLVDPHRAALETMALDLFLRRTLRDIVNQAQAGTASL
jgi:hypothetical protein